MNLEEGDLAPDFALQADDGSEVRLSDLRGKPVVLFFYPKADTPGCTVEACAFRDLYPKISEKGAVTFGISPDSVRDVSRFKQKFGFPYQLLADPDHSVAELYGVWKEKSNFGRKYWGVERRTFLVDAGGKITRTYAGIAPEEHSAEVLEALG